MKPRALDLCCCEGGASAGLVAAGFDVLGVDIEPQPRYPFEFLQADALTLEPEFLAGFDLVWASPHCQGYSRTRAIHGREYARQIPAFRALLQAAGVPYIIENVPGSDLRVTTVLRGSDFGLPIHRERWFESNRLLLSPGVGMPWASRRGLAQCVPPVYAEFLGRQML